MNFGIVRSLYFRVFLSAAVLARSIWPRTVPCWQSARERVSFPYGVSLERGNVGEYAHMENVCCYFPGINDSEQVVAITVPNHMLIAMFAFIILCSFRSILTNLPHFKSAHCTCVDKNMKIFSKF